MAGTASRAALPAHPPAAPASERRRQRLTLLACILGSSAAFLDGTLVNVALPAIRADLHGGLATQEWIVDGYLLTLGSLLLVGGSLGDVVGRRRVFAAGVTGFGAASALCAVAPGAGTLIAARALQGVAGALLVPSTLALIMDTFAKEEQAAAIGTWTAWTGVATVAGPLVGGALVQAASWRWIFLVNLPLVAATLWLLRHAPRGRQVLASHIDWTGGLLCALGLGGPIFALIEQPSYGWSDRRVWIPLVGGSVLLWAFVVWERRSRAPMLPLGLFRARDFRVGNLTTLMFYGALSASTFFLVVFLEQVAGYSALKAGAALIPMPILTFLLARRFGALADRIGPRLLMGFGPVIAAVGLLLLLAVDQRARYLTQIFPGMAVFALGLAITVAPLTAAVLGAVESERSGAASGVNNAVARVAGLIAIAAIGAVVSSQFATRLDEGFPASTRSPQLDRAIGHAKARSLVISTLEFSAAKRRQARRVLVGASVDGYRLSIEISAALAGAGGLLSLGGIANPRRRVLAEGCAGGALVGASLDVVNSSGR